MDLPDFDVIPAVDIHEGEVVQLVQGERETARRYGDPATAARRWVDEGAKRLHLVDLDGAFAGERVNATAIEEMLEAVDVPVQLGGGIRTESDARTLLEQGLDQLILGTAAIESPDLVETLSREYPNRIIVSLDAKDGEVVVKGWTEKTGLDPATAASRYADIGAAGILFTDVDVEGQLAGVQTTPLQRVVDAVDIPVIASGGVSTLPDIGRIADTGAAAVVIGTALYEGKFTLTEARATISSAR